MGRENGTFYEVITLGDQNIDFLKDIVADSPVPAGGAAAVYTSCLAFGLLHKVILLQLHRDRSEVISENCMILARKDVKRLLEDMERFVAENSESYLSLLNQDKIKIKRTLSHISVKSLMSA